ncbi:MAG TPA: RnfABCDGE type electron transport complex subunit G [Gammaproteobacteria bacterium]|nr:RnfABCDGE type electron transport complex subunit G [Gammaproteobacteria bacterium]
MANAEGSRLVTVLLAAAIVVAAGIAVTSAYEWSSGRIAANERARVVARLNSVLDSSLRGRDLTTTRLDITDAELLGSDDPVDVFVVSEAGEPVAVLFASVAPHGYNAAINLLIGVSPAGVVTGVRAVRHRETSGLGDAIESAKSAWIEQFSGKTLASPDAILWAVQQDDGAFDAITGATVTSRAVVAAVKNTLLYFDRHRSELYAAAAAAAAADDDGRPE